MGESAAQRLSIDEVSRDSGIGKDTLRVWERRYGFPQPLRNAKGERSYPGEQMNRLRAICRLLDAGHRPGAVVPLEPGALTRLCEVSSDADGRLNPALDQVLERLAGQEPSGIRALLLALLVEQGPEAFVRQSVAPLVNKAGQLWAQGSMPIYREHLLTQQLMGVLHRAIHAVQIAPGGLSVLLTTLPGEPHAIGLMMVELLLRLEGFDTINLGAETPLDQLINACTDLQPSVVALSFSSLHKRAPLLASLRELEEKIPQETVLIAGGEGIARLRSLPSRVAVIKTLDTLAPALRAIKRQQSQLQVSGEVG